MSCSIAAGRTEPCKDSVGGIKEVYMINFQSGIVYTPDGSNDEEYTALTAADGTTLLDAFRFEVRMASSFTSNMASSRENGTTVFTTSLSLTFKKLSAADNKEIVAMAKGRPIIIVVDNNDNQWIVGHEYGCELTGGTMVTGAAMSDLYGYTLDFTATERSLPKYLTGNLDTLLGTITPAIPS
jgi:hypothetical protein